MKDLKTTDHNGLQIPEEGDFGTHSINDELK
jgi:hypothetical protein